MTQNNEISDRIASDLKARLEKEGDHLQVKDVNGEHVGTVDHLDGDQLKLTKTDSEDGQHHYVPLVAGGEHGRSGRVPERGPQRPEVRLVARGL